MLRRDEHRNHLIVMSPTPVPIVNGRLTHDFTQSDSYISLIGHGQKEMSDGSFDDVSRQYRA